MATMMAIAMAWGTGQLNANAKLQCKLTTHQWNPLLECLTAACKALSLANAKEKDRWLDWEKSQKSQKSQKSEISERDLQKTFWEI